MSESNKPFIPAEQHLPEITFKAVCLAIILALVLAASNTYLALKVGILTSASIPAAVLSMGILRAFKRSNILENNLVQTAASAGEAVAGGIVYIIPALIIIHFWSHFNYWQNVSIALAGGVLGVLFSVPLRQVLVTEKNLGFPEGKAIAEVLKIGAKQDAGLKEMLWGGAVGAFLEFAQTGLQVIASNAQFWYSAGGALFGFGAGFSATMVGAGYLIGARIGLGLFIGAVIGWLFAVPLLTSHYGIVVSSAATTQTVMTFWSSHIRYVGVGAMLLAGFWTLCTFIRPVSQSLAASLKALAKRASKASVLRTEKDMPTHYVLVGIGLALVGLYFLFKQIFQLDFMPMAGFGQVLFILTSLVYVLIFGFVISAVCGYFSGLVGVSATPGSGMILAGLLIAALLLRSVMSFYHPLFTHTELLQAAAVVIIIGAVIAGSAAIANDNIQDLKVGHLVGATPWKQQVMLLLGVGVASMIVPAIMELLFNVYGLADVFPHAGMDPSEALAAPPAAMMAAVAQAVFKHNLPWDLVWLGVGIISAGIVLNFFLKPAHRLSLLSIAIGIYLPLASSIPLIVGSAIAWWVQRTLQKQKDYVTASKPKLQRGILLACGLVSGAALMDVLLAIPFAMAKNPDVLRIMPASGASIATGLGVLTLFLLAGWFYRIVCRR